MNWFQRLFSTGQKVKEFQTATFSNTIGDSSVSQQNLLSNNKNWVFVAVDRIASAISSVRLKVMKYEKGDDVEVFDHPLVTFLNRPSQQFTGKDFLYLHQSYKDLTGNALWLIGEDRKSITPLISTKVKPIVKDGLLEGYEYRDGSISATYTVDRVLHDRYAMPEKPYWGVGILEKIAGWVDTDGFASEFNRLFFVNGATFGGFIETDEESRERIELIKTGLQSNHVGVKNSHKIAVLPKNSKFTSASSSMTDMQFVQLDDKYRDKILAGFGVPKTLAGLTTDVNRASAEASEYIFARYTIKPKLDRLVDFLNNYVVPLFDKSGNIYIAYEDFIPENEDLELREREIALNRQPYKTINEVRAEEGLPPITGGDVVYGNPFALPIGSPQEVKKAPRAEVKTFSEDIAQKVADIVDSKVDKDAFAHKDFVSRTEAYVKLVAQKVQDFNQKQKQEVISRLSTIAKSVKKSDLFDYDKDVSVMVDFVSPILGSLFKEQALKEYEAQGFEGAFDVDSDFVRTAVERASKRMAKSYNDTTALLLKNALNEGIRENESLSDITKRVADIYEFSDVTRASMVAHTEAFYTANEASKEAYRQSGVVTSIRWYTGEDELVCDLCEPMNGKEVGVEENFFDKGDTVHGRNGASMSADYRAIDVPPLHPNCRCFIRPENIAVTRTIEAEKKDADQKVEELDTFIEDLLKEVKDL